MAVNVSTNGTALPEGGSSLEGSRTLTEIALANRVFAMSMAQQNAVQRQQSLSLIELALIGKCVELIGAIDPAEPDAFDRVKACKGLIDEVMTEFGRNDIVEQINAARP